MGRKAGGNQNALCGAAAEAADIMRNGSGGGKGLKPVAVEAADRVAAQLKGWRGGLSLDGARDRLLTRDAIKQNGMIAGGALVTVVGLRSMLTKDEDGERHIGRGAAITAGGLGLFTLGLAAKRAGADKGEGPRH